MDDIACISTIEGLIETLEESDPTEFPSILKNMEIPSSEFHPYASWKPEGYTRNCIVRSKNFELVLLCWNAGDETPIHSHDGQKCWVYQVESELVEERYQKGDDGEPELVYKQTLKPGNLTYMDDRMGYHVLANRTQERSSTLHLYMLPIDNCEYYCEDEGSFKEKELEYDNSGDLPIP